MANSEEQNGEALCKRSFHPVHDLFPGVLPETKSSVEKKSAADEFKFHRHRAPPGDGSLPKARTRGWAGFC
jgi:hypothetical protein